MECYCDLRNVQDLPANGKTPHERRFGKSFKGPIVPFGALVEYLPISKSSIWRESINRDFSRICIDRGGIWKGDILIAEVEEFENWTHQKYPRRLNAKEVLIIQRNREFVFPVADGSAKFSGRDCEFQEPTLRREQTVRSEGLSGFSRRSGRVSTCRTKKR